MKFKKIIAFSFLIVFFSCNIEPIDDSMSSDETDIDPPVSEFVRVKQAVGYLNGVEVAKEEFTYSNNKLLNTKVYNKNGDNWDEVTSYDFTYNGNNITQSFLNGRAEYVSENNRLASINYFDDEVDDENDGYLFRYTNTKLDGYTYFEGYIGETWNYKSNCVYTNDNIIEINNERNSPSEPNFVPDFKTTFSYNGDQLTGWIADYTVASPDDEEFNEKIDYEYSNGRISKAIENKWIPDNSTWEIVAEISYTYNDNGNLITQKYIEIGDEFTENHLYDYFYFDDFANDFDEVRYTYEDGESNNYILLYPEFIAHKTPNPYILITQ